MAILNARIMQVEFETSHLNLTADTLLHMIILVPPAERIPVVLLHEATRIISTQHG